MTGENNYKFSGYRDIRRTFWNKLRTSANKRNLPITITIEDIWNLFESQGRQCALSDVPIQFGVTYPLSATTVSIDRIDNAIGYTPGNIQLVHKAVNMMRGSLSVHDFREWCSRVTNEWRKKC